MSSRLKPSNFRLMATLRSRHSWTRWRLRRKQARLARETRRLELLQQLGAEQVLLLQRLERELHPLRVVEQRPRPEPEPQSPPPVMAPALVTPERHHREPEPGLLPTLPEEPPEPEEQMAPVEDQLSQLLGLQTRRSTSPVSQS